MDYDCQVYISFSAEILKKLDSIHIRIYKRAFRTSPVEALHVEANDPLLELKKKQTGTKIPVQTKKQHLIHRNTKYTQRQRGPKL